MSNDSAAPIAKGVSTGGAGARGGGRLVVLSGPSGVGKTTLVRGLLARPELNLTLSVSATTRAPREGEVHGRDYLFMDRESFLKAREAGEFLEWAEVHGNLYGTPMAEARRALEAGRNVLLEIDVAGARQVRERAPDALLIFLRPRDPETLERRLRGRGTDDEETIQRRLRNARAELAAAPEYDLQVVNDDLERAIEEVAAHIPQGAPSRHD